MTDVTETPKCQRMRWVKFGLLTCVATAPRSYRLAKTAAMLLQPASLEGDLDGSSFWDGVDTRTAVFRVLTAFAGQCRCTC